MGAVRSRSPQVGAQGHRVDQGHHCLTLNSCLPNPVRQRTAQQVSGNAAETAGLDVLRAPVTSWLTWVPAACSRRAESSAALERFSCPLSTLSVTKKNKFISQQESQHIATTWWRLGWLLVLTRDFKALGAQRVFGLQVHFQKWYEPQICSVAFGLVQL